MRLMARPRALASCVRAAALALPLLRPPSAFAWGAYAHQQIEATAVRLLAGRGHPLARLLSPNLETLKRLSVAPDADWSRGRGGGLERTLHFFEVDAFVDAERDPSSVLSLPSGDYLSVQPRYRELLLENETKVRDASPGRPLTPEAHGTAPWRVLQLYDLAVDALRNQDAAKALLYLGALGHYAGDLSEPLRIVMDRDGERYGEPAAGIFDAFEDGIFEAAAGREGRSKRRRKPGAARVYDTTATEAQVQQETVQALQASGLRSLPRDAIVPEGIALAQSGLAYIPQLLGAFARDCAELQVDDPETNAQTYCVARRIKGKVRISVPRAVVKLFAEEKLEGDASKGLPPETVLEAAESRLGAAAALTARLWVSAYEAAGRPPLSGERVPFGSIGVLKDRPDPAYLPGAVR